MGLMKKLVPLCGLSRQGASCEGEAVAGIEGVLVCAWHKRQVAAIARKAKVPPPRWMPLDRALAEVEAIKKARNEIRRREQGEQAPRRGRPRKKRNEEAAA